MLSHDRRDDLSLEGQYHILSRVSAANEVQNMKS